MNTYIHIKNILNKIKPFPDELVDMFYDAVVFRQIKKDGALLRQGQVCDFVALVLKGSLRVYYQKEEKDFTVNFFTEDDWAVDHYSILSQQPSQNRIQAMEATEVALISLRDAHQLMAKDQRFMVLFRVLQESAILPIFSVHNTAPQERYNILMQQHPEWMIRFSQKHISSYLGMTPETFSRLKRRYLFS